MVSIAARLRSHVLALCGHRCVYCGAGEEEAGPLTIDHVEPRMRGGDRSPGNLVAACAACNAAKGSLPAWRYLATRDEERARFLALGAHVWPRLRRAVEEAALRSRTPGRGAG
jgi:5-methylcytosine-specific restriction endonuclease McrA